LYNDLSEDLWVVKVVDEWRMFGTHYLINESGWTIVAYEQEIELVVQPSDILKANTDE
jgi:hypothetical protein